MIYNLSWTIGMADHGGCSLPQHRACDRGRQ
jgi:hypothetical protein